MNEIANHLAFTAETSLNSLYFYNTYETDQNTDNSISFSCVITILIHNHYSRNSHHSSTYAELPTCHYSKKVLLSLKNHILRWTKIIFVADHASWARNASRARSSFGRGPGPLKGPGSTLVLGALWCNLSLIFEHYYSKTLTKFS